jgi:hypothetical protein
MSRKKKIHRQQRRRLQRQKRDSQAENIVFDTAAVFTCATETAQDFVHQCESRIEDVEIDLTFTDLAKEIWAAHPARAKSLTDALIALAAEQQRYLALLEEFCDRFDALAADQALAHQHLDPVEPYRDLVRRRLFPDNPSDLVGS